MFKHKVVAVLMGAGLLAMQSLSVNAQVDDPQNRGAWPKQLPARMPASVKYHEERERQLQQEQARAAKERKVGDPELERGAYPKQLPVRMPASIKYHQERERALKANPSVVTGTGFPAASDEADYWHRGQAQAR